MSEIIIHDNLKILKKFFKNFKNEEDFINIMEILFKKIGIYNINSSFIIDRIEKIPNSKNRRGSFKCQCSIWEKSKKEENKNKKVIQLIFYPETNSIIYDADKIKKSYYYDEEKLAFIQFGEIDQNTETILQISKGINSIMIGYKSKKESLRQININKSKNNSDKRDIFQLIDMEFLFQYLHYLHVSSFISFNDILKCIYKCYIYNDLVGLDIQIIESMDKEDFNHKLRIIDNNLESAEIKKEDKTIIYANRKWKYISNEIEISLGIAYNEQPEVINICSFNKEFKKKEFDLKIEEIINELKRTKTTINDVIPKTTNKNLF